MELNSSNYCQLEANMEYMSASQFKSFMSCEALALAALRGQLLPRATSTDMLVGSYVDAYFSGEMEVFLAEHPEVVSSRGPSKGRLKAEFQQAETVIQRIKRDAMMMKYLSGQTQVIRTGEIAGVPFKIKMDSYHPGKCIVDLKVMRDFSSFYNAQEGRRIHWVEWWKYDFQLAVYQAVEGNRLPSYIAAASKETEPDIRLYQIPQERLDYCLDIVRRLAPHFQSVKQGREQPEKCCRCDYCKSTKVLQRIINYQEEAV